MFFKDLVEVVGRTEPAAEGDFLDAVFCFGQQPPGGFDADPVDLFGETSPQMLGEQTGKLIV